MGKLIDFLKVLGYGLFYSLLYLSGKKSGVEEVEAKVTESTLKERNRVVTEREKIREESDDLKARISNDWDSIERMRKTRSR